MNHLNVPVPLQLLFADLLRGPSLRVALAAPGAPALHAEVARVQTASVAWACEFGLIDASQVERLARARIAWLPARAYPRGQVLALQIAADWTTLFCLLDDAIEREADPVAVSRRLERLLAIFEPGVHAGDEPMQRACVDLRERIAATGRERLARFTARLRELFAAFVVEAQARAQGTIPGLAEYLPLRAQTVGLYVEFELGEIADAIVLTAAERASAERTSLARLASDLVGWANDIYTHEKELRAGETHNLVFVLAHAEGLSLATAAQRAVQMHDAALLRFAALAEATARGASPAMRGYVAMLQAWVRGHLDWGRETGRYAGEEVAVPRESQQDGPHAIDPPRRPRRHPPTPADPRGRPRERAPQPCPGHPRRL